MRAIKPELIRQTRERLGMSQAEFARAFHLNFRSVQDWELRGVAGGPTAVLMWLISKMPRHVLKALRDF